MEYLYRAVCGYPERKDFFWWGPTRNTLEEGVDDLQQEIRDTPPERQYEIRLVRCPANGVGGYEILEWRPM